MRKSANSVEQLILSDKNDIRLLLEDKILYLQTIIQNTALSVQQHKKTNVFSNKQTRTCLFALKDLYDKSITFINNLHDVEFSIDTIIESTQHLADELATIISANGTKNIDDILFICFGTEFKTKRPADPILNAKLDIIKSSTCPISYKIYSWKNGHTSTVSDDNYCSNKMTDDTKTFEYQPHLECLFTMSNDITSFAYQMNGLQIIFQNEKAKKTLVIQAIVDDTIVDFCNSKYIDHRKEKIINNFPTPYDPYDIELLERMVSVMTLKDYLVYGNEDIYKKHILIQHDVKNVKINKLETTIKKFIDLETIAKRDLLVNLITYGKDDNVKYITYILYNILNVNNKELDSIEQSLIYDSLPWKTKQHFKDVMTVVSECTEKILNKYDITRISLEQQIYLMQGPDIVRDKALAKLAEISNRQDETAAKAKTYLEGLLKMPFGYYRQEPILKSMKEVNTKINALILSDVLPIKLGELKYKYYTNVEISQIINRLKQSLSVELFDQLKTKINNASVKEINLIFNVLVESGQIQPQTECKTKQSKQSAIIQFIESIKHDNDVMERMQMTINKENPYTKTLMEIKDIEKKSNEVTEYLSQVKSELDESIHGHNTAKSQMQKIIGQWISGEQTGYCFGFEGSPGIGKTSLAKKGLSNCLKDENGVSRPFAFIALGGSANSTTLEGYGYTYVNSTWGRIADILMESKCMNPIIYIDELDKVSKTDHGKEIIGILTHLIDPTQNDVFQDKYFAGINIDLSKALFIFSYNDPDQIDRILLDRIHRIKFDNLTVTDKIVIVEKHILPEIHRKMGFSPDTVILRPEIIEYLVEKYTLEPGVRKLKEVIFDLFGEINMQMLNGNSELKIPVIITESDIETKYLKTYVKIDERKIHHAPKVGIINGLWANVLGKGGIIPIEVVKYPSSTYMQLKLTGMQGDVMKESMNVACSLAWNLSSHEKQKVIGDNMQGNGIHIHCPEGAVSKDGPSAGTAITVAIYSLFNEKQIKNDIAITGEISLQGTITAIGGLEMKILGGIRAGVKTFIFPEENKSDYNKVYDKYSDTGILDNIKFISVTNIHDVLPHVFV